LLGEERINRPAADWMSAKPEALIIRKKKDPRGRKPLADAADLFYHGIPGHIRLREGRDGKMIISLMTRVTEKVIRKGARKTSKKPIVN